MGDFAVERVDGSERIGAPRSALQPASWIDQGYPYYSGRGLYRCRFALPDNFADQRIFLEPEMRDDTLEVLVNDQRAAVRLWEPYEIELTDYLKPGDNTLELQWPALRSTGNRPPWPGWPVPRGWFPTGWSRLLFLASSLHGTPHPNPLPVRGARGDVSASRPSAYEPPPLWTPRSSWVLALLCNRTDVRCTGGGNRG